MNGGHRLWLAIALLLAAALRLWDVGSLELTHWDEGVYAAFGLDYGPGFRGDPWIIYAPPAYPALVAIGYFAVGAAPWVAIAVSGAMGVLGVFLASRLATVWFGPRAGVIAAFLLACEPLHVAHSRLALTETTFCVFLLATLLAATRALESSRAGDAVSVGARAGLALLAKFHGFLPLAAYGVLALVRRRPVLAVVAGIGFLPSALLAAWIVHSTCGFERFAESREQWVNGLHPWSIRQTVEFAWLLATEHSSPASVILAVIGAIAAAFAVPRRDAPWLGLLTLALLAIVLCTYRNYVRLFVPAVVLLVPFAAFAIDRAASRPAWARRAPALVVVSVALAGALGWRPLLETLRFRGDGYAKMGALLRDELGKDPGAEVVVVAQQSLFPYLGEELAARVFSINEREAIDRLEADAARYLVTDQDPWRHGRARPFRESLAPRLVEVARIDNPLPRATLLDRLGPGWDRTDRAARDGRPALDAERFLILYRITPAPR